MGKKYRRVNVVLPSGLSQDFDDLLARSGWTQTFAMRKGLELLLKHSGQVEMPVELVQKTVSAS